MQKSIAKLYRIGRSTVHEIIHDTCKFIYETLKPEHLPMPSTEKWVSISKEFENKWQFPNCLGAVDGKHFSIKAPSNSGTQYFNYKVA